MVWWELQPREEVFTSCSLYEKPRHKNRAERPLLKGPFVLLRSRMLSRYAVESTGLSITAPSARRRLRPSQIRMCRYAR